MKCWINRLRAKYTRVSLIKHEASAGEPQQKLINEQVCVILRDVTMSVFVFSELNASLELLQSQSHSRSE